MDKFSERDDRAERAAALQQRIGERYAIRIPIIVAPPPTSRWRSNPKGTEVITDDWSLTGIGFVTELRDDLRASMPIMISTGPVTGAAVVQVVRPAEKPGECHYGVEFRDQALEDVARHLISIHLNKVPADRPARSPAPEILGPYRPDSLSDFF